MTDPIRPGLSSLLQTATQVARTVTEVAKKVGEQVASAAGNAASTAQSVFEAASNAPAVVDINGGTPVSQGPVVRDGGPATALAWANEQMGNTGYDDACLNFVIRAYAIHQTAARAPEINYASGTNNAIGAFNGLQREDKIRTASPETPLDAGAIVFFDATEDNDDDGHICIATGRMAADGTPEVITSGYEGAPGVHLSSIGQLIEDSGPYLGYTTPELAFAEGMWPGPSETSASGGATPTAAPRPTTTPEATNPSGNAPQAWNNTCGANALMSMEASLDPERAARFATLSPDERAAYEGAVLRSHPDNDGFALGSRPGGTTTGWGLDMMKWQVSDRFGGEATVVKPDNRKQAVDALTTQLAEGKPVAIGLADHWLSATAMRQGESGQELLIHDSWTGTSAWVPEADLREPGSGWMRTYFPNAPFEGAIHLLVAPGEPVLEPDSVYRGTEAGLLEGVRAEMR
ncbi:hypothetical protein [Archangium lipolyticum]|uniref:hypothetical protein n=1 Tax=Archangium lipolyticum TaxID=2970465 RepID=UPI002149A6BD|nr:hypothetical protein [Archangium lipolyticum]